MSKLTQTIGFVFLALGLLLAVVVFKMPGSMSAIGISMDAAAVFIVGGGICLGLQAVKDAIQAAVNPVEVEISQAAPITQREKAPADRRTVAETKPSAAVAAVASAATGAAAAKFGPPPQKTEPRPSVADTLEALEQAKSDIAAALSMDKPAERLVEKSGTLASLLERPVIEKVVKEETVIISAPPLPPEDLDEEIDDPDLYVVEEKVIRGRPARVLSDGTVEAETDEGWMRFENLEHLDEYLDATSPRA